MRIHFRAAMGLRATPQRIAAFNATYGLDKPLYAQFGDYVAYAFVAAALMLALVRRRSKAA